MPYTRSPGCSGCAAYGTASTTPAKSLPSTAGNAPIAAATPRPARVFASIGIDRRGHHPHEHLVADAERPRAPRRGAARRALRCGRSRARASSRPSAVLPVVGPFPHYAAHCAPRSGPMRRGRGIPVRALFGVVAGARGSGHRHGHRGPVRAELVDGAEPARIRRELLQLLHDPVERADGDRAAGRRVVRVHAAQRPVLVQPGRAPAR